MSLMERVRELGAAEAHTTDESVRTARTALAREIARISRPERMRRSWRRRAGLGIGGLVAGVAATVVVVGSVLSPVEAPTASAADVLNAAAEAALRGADANLQAGDFLRIEVTRDYLVTDGQVRGLPMTENAFRYLETDVLYVPADRSDEWVYDHSTPTTVTERWGVDAAEFEESVMAGYGYRATDIVRMPSGVLASGPVTPWLESFDTMPRNPEQLLAWARDSGGAEPGYESKVLLDALHLNLPPADLRAALFEALALIPGIEVSMQDGARMTLTRNTEFGSQQFVVDTETGMMVAFIDSSVEAPGSAVPADEAGLIETFTTTVVDSAP